MLEDLDLPLALPEPLAGEEAFLAPPESVGFFLLRVTFPLLEALLLLEELPEELERLEPEELEREPELERLELLLPDEEL